jgi:hypothetical protein
LRKLRVWRWWGVAEAKGLEMVGSCEAKGLGGYGVVAPGTWVVALRA